MSFGFSVGDVIACGKLAWDLGQLFTSGRRGAPAKYREVENQLYALSKSLELLEDAVNQGEIALKNAGPQARPVQSGHGLDSMKAMLNNCNHTLMGLKSITDKYSEPLTAPSGSSGSLTVSSYYSSSGAYSTTRKWRKKIVQNWYKVWWTTEGEDIRHLTSNLVVHTNSINLMVGTITSQTSTRILNNVENFAPKIDRMMNMFEEIYTWHERGLNSGTEVEVETRQTIGNFQPAPPYSTAGDVGRNLSQLSQMYQEVIADHYPVPRQPSPRPVRVTAAPVSLPTGAPTPPPKKQKAATVPIKKNILEPPKARPAPIPLVGGGFINDSTGSLASTISSSSSTSSVQTVTQTVTQGQSMKRKSRAGKHDITFDLAIQTESCTPSTLCPNASLHGAWTSCSNPDENEDGMFICLCESVAGIDGEAEPHGEVLKGYYLSQATLAVRYSGQTKWALHRTVRYKFNDGTEKFKQELVTLSMQVANPSHESKFERIFVEPLALRTAKASLQEGGVPPELAHKVYSDKRVAILNCETDNSNFDHEVESIAFTLAGGTRTVKVNQVIHADILHYKTMNSDSVKQSTDLWRDVPKYEETAEMIFRFAKTGASEEFRSLNLYASETDLSNISECDDGDTTVISLPHIKIGKASVLNPKKGVDYRVSGKITIKFKHPEAAMVFCSRIEDMQKELRALKIQFPRRSEKIMLKLFAGDISAGRMKMANAEITVVYNPNSKMGRVLVKAGDSSAYLSQNLNPGFFNKFSELSKGTLFLGSAEYLDNIGQKEIRKYPEGVGTIQFDNKDMDQLFFDRLTEAAEQFGFYRKSDLPQEEIYESPVSRDETPIVRYSVRPDFKFDLKEVETAVSTKAMDLSRPMDAEELFTLFNQSSRKDQSERIQEPWTRITETEAIDAPPDVADDFPYMRGDFNYPLQPSMPAERSLEDIMLPKKYRRSFSDSSLATEHYLQSQGLADDSENQESRDESDGLEISRVLSHDHSYLKPNHHHYHHHHHHHTKPEEIRVTKSAGPSTPKIESPTLGAMKVETPYKPLESPTLGTLVPLTPRPVTPTVVIPTIERPGVEILKLDSPGVQIPKIDQQKPEVAKVEPPKPIPLILRPVTPKMDIGVEAPKIEGPTIEVQQPMTPKQRPFEYPTSPANLPRVVSPKILNITPPPEKVIPKISADDELGDDGNDAEDSKRFVPRPSEVSMAVFDSILKFKEKGAIHRRSKSMNPLPKPKSLLPRNVAGDLDDIDVPRASSATFRPEGLFSPPTPSSSSTGIRPQDEYDPLTMQNTRGNGIHHHQFKMDAPEDSDVVIGPEDVSYERDILDKTPDVENLSTEAPKAVSLSSSFMEIGDVNHINDPVTPPTNGSSIGRRLEEDTSSWNVVDAMDPYQTGGAPFTSSPPPLPLISSKENLKELVMDDSIIKTQAFRVLDDSYEPDMEKDTLVWISRNPMEPRIDTSSMKKKYWATDVSGENTCWIRGSSLKEENYYCVDETVKSQDRSHPVRLLKGEHVIVLSKGPNPEDPDDLWRVVHLGGKSGDIAIVPKRVLSFVR